MLLSRRTLVKGPEKPEFGHRPPVWIGTNHVWPNKPTGTKYSLEETLTHFKDNYSSPAVVTKAEMVMDSLQAEKTLITLDISE